MLNGLGTRETYIKEWIEDIFNTYDLDGNGTLSPYEVQDFLDKILSEVKVSRKFSNEDFGDFWNEIDLNRTGEISRTKLFFYFRKLGMRRPDNKLKRVLKLKNFIAQDG